MPKRAIRKICILMFLFIFTFSFALPASAITEEEVQKQVDTQGREAVTGNVFIWFLCAVGFLKVSQRMDSLLSSLGISVGHTGGNMLGEAMIAARAIGAATGRHFHGFGGGSGGSSGGGGGSGSGSGTGFLSGGLVGAVGRQVTKSAVNAATGQGGNPLTRMAFNSSLAQGGNFANGIIGAVARGNIAHTGSITGQPAADAASSYMGYTDRDNAPTFSDVEIGGGRIMGTETSSEHPGGISFGLYSVDQYMPTDGTYTTQKAVDGSMWYKQYAQDSVEKTPYMTENGQIGYHESIVQKLPPIPKRKDKV